VNISDEDEKQRLKKLVSSTTVEELNKNRKKIFIFDDGIDEENYL